VAEWLRRQPAKLLGSTRAGSNPAVVETFLLRDFVFLLSGDGVPTTQPRRARKEAGAPTLKLKGRDT
jgi:hypothetical protein